jgi:membrane protease YdiL (CAAX protease family)
MSSFESGNSPGPMSSSSRTWGFLDTTFIGFLAFIVFAASYELTINFLVSAQDRSAKLSPIQLDALSAQGRWVGIALVVGCPPAIAVLWIAIRKIGRGFAEYLALNWPSARELMRALAIMAIAAIVESAVGTFIHAEVPAPNPYLVVNGAGGLFILLVGGCMAGPMMEEFLYRGFLFRGWSQSKVGPLGAIVLASVVFAMTHQQYDWFERSMVFFDGLLLGHFRWRSNSTWLPVIVHSARNIASFVLMGPYV